MRLEHGKPVLKSGNSFFNLSHSGEYTVLAAADIDIGVDIEQIKDVHWPTVQKIFTAEQREQLERTGEAGQPELFAKYWTECEAVLKLKGTGFAGRDCDVRHRAGEDWIRRRETAFEGLFVQVQGIHDCMCCIWSVLCIS